MNSSGLIYAALLFQSGPICTGTIGTPWLSGDKSEKFDERFEPSTLLQNIPSMLDVRVQKAADEIVSHTGIKSNFTVAPANVANALAYIGRDGSRLLLYNPMFMEDVFDNVCKDWGIMDITAHEIGHHLQGHIFRGVDIDYHQFEIEADEFSGFVLYRMGATLEEAQRSTAALAQLQDTATHPGRARRLEAIKAGWLRARDVAGHEGVADAQRKEREAD